MTVALHVLLETELPMAVVGWGIFFVSLAIAVSWLAYLYR